MKKYDLERVFYDSKGNQTKIYRYGLKPMTHDEAVSMMNKMYHKSVYGKYNCIDRIVEV